ncbi:HEPN domain-containing protein [Mesorhizobium sp.]|uniref:HEPN domain-containing protein n=1 Tax=Mesorhizobium sp. TaxID=1871066 RepID=UPI000FE631E6|nr:HEPN domain-containing protein [Mesorhizobium sp.]RWM08954.1 MAG: hypothetical protein EOR71_10595 [Mesorhizobium sp.]
MTNQEPDLRKYAKLLEGAFDELHAAVIKTLDDTRWSFGTHHDYPTMGMTESGFPYFSEVGFYNEKARKDYVGVFRPRSLAGLLMSERLQENFPAGAELIEFLKSNELGKKFQLEEPYSESYVDRMVGDCVERYFQLYGTGPVQKRKRQDILKLAFFGTVEDSLEVRLVVPIALTHFQVDRYRLNETTYIARIPRATQLSRSRIGSRGSGAERGVVSAATHAFVSNGWSIPNKSLQNVRNGLNEPSGDALDTVDRFMASLRAATGAVTGYAQVLFLPRGWATEFYCDLPSVYGANCRRYPNSFDNYGWSGGGQSAITRTQLDDVKRIYNRILERREERVLIALKRLNACMTRDDAVDAILDATIGIEVLLGDKENQALSYKLRIRAGALASLSGSMKPTDVSAAVKNIYDVRSRIVHGLDAKKSKKQLLAPEDERYASERKAAADMLRFLIDVLLEFPQYLDPLKIDRELILGPRTQPGGNGG